MNFKDLLTKHFTAVETIVNTNGDRFQSPDTTKTWLDLQAQLKADLQDIPEEKRDAAVRMAAIELVSMMLYPADAPMPDTGSGVPVGLDIDDQSDLEMPETAQVDTGWYRG